MDTKKCAKCGRALPATTEYFRLIRGKLRSRCKDCLKAQDKEYCARNSEALHRTQKRYREKNLEALHEKGREYYERNREAVLERASLYRQANPEKFREIVRRSSAKRRDKRIKYTEAHRESIEQYQKAYYQGNKDRLRERRRPANHARRARDMAAPGTHTEKDIQIILKAQRGRCYYCGTKVGKNYHVDHVIPLSRGGSNGPENLVIACPHCNVSKGAKLPHEWTGTDKLL